MSQQGQTQLQAVQQSISRKHLVSLIITFKQYNFTFFTKSCLADAPQFHTLSCTMTVRVNLQDA
ncbi:hypothetical protein UNDYM_5119 [Undibacterium sp. YM2]|nr:hypothetical protein UNDYM_5119 [Undibacterium sp. YM2]